MTLAILIRSCRNRRRNVVALSRCENRDLLYLGDESAVIGSALNQYLLETNCNNEYRSRTESALYFCTPWNELELPLMNPYICRRNEDMRNVLRLKRNSWIIETTIRF